MTIIGRYGLVAFLLMAGEATRADADLVLLDAANRGSYRSDTNQFGTGGAGTANGNYVTGTLAMPGLPEFRSFFHFDLGSVQGEITSARLLLALGSPSSVDRSETLGLFDFRGDKAALIAGTGGASAFADLGSGASYGEVTVTIPLMTPQVPLSIAFNAAGLADLNAAIGGSFAVGGALTSLRGGPQFLFGGTFGSTSSLTRLELEVVGIPEPSSLALCGIAGLAGLCLARRSRGRLA